VPDVSRAGQTKENDCTSLDDRLARPALQSQGSPNEVYRNYNLLKKSRPEILEARWTIKTSSPKGKKGRRSYIVKTFVHLGAGWDLLSVFDSVLDRLKRMMARKGIRRTRRGRWA
jgi:hypothetical protein